MKIAIILYFTILFAIIGGYIGYYKAKMKQIENFITSARNLPKEIVYDILVQQNEQDKMINEKIKELNAR